MADEPKKPERENQSVLDDIGALAKGLKTTLGEYFSPQVTTEYPEEKSPRSERYRGRHYLRRYDNGLERCIGCELCAAACPVGCILVIAAENSDENRVSPGERYAKTYEINMLRCIFCGYCEDACPVQAIVLGPEYARRRSCSSRFRPTCRRGSTDPTLALPRTWGRGKLRSWRSPSSSSSASWPSRGASASSASISRYVRC
ncbi:MAG: NADH-quinone oxidoreductase subunit I [Chloroflexi bacterium]|nr:MAG: NADH-quinone oxidoreductase subunit I [Chloroflexota bacterium]